MPLAAEVDAEYRALKHDRSVLDNDDLLTLAYEALKNDPRVQAEFSGKFKMVMVDEFQDTAQQQVELVSCSAAPMHTSSARWAMPNSPSTRSRRRCLGVSK